MLFFIYAIIGMQVKHPNAYMLYNGNVSLKGMDHQLDSAVDDQGAGTYTNSYQEAKTDIIFD
jgi:hypothetical protein